jgi:hypothetical protein
MARQIPNGAVEIQRGLWLNQVTVTVLGQTRIRYELYSSEGYCFYDNTWAEEDRIYWQYISLGFTDDSENYTSILIEEGMEIAGKPSKPEIA